MGFVEPVELSCLNPLFQLRLKRATTISFTGLERFEILFIFFNLGHRSIGFTASAGKTGSSESS